MNKRVSILSLVGFLIAFGVIFGWFNNGMDLGFSSFFAFFILFGFLGNVFRSKTDHTDHTNKGDYQNTFEENSDFMNLPKRKRELMECEYCGHKNDKGREYCENCGARVLPY